MEPKTKNQGLASRCRRTDGFTAQPIVECLGNREGHNAISRSGCDDDLFVQRIENKSRLVIALLCPREWESSAGGSVLTPLCGIFQISRFPPFAYAINRDLGA